jgi:hypothetical protein
MNLLTMIAVCVGIALFSCSDFLEKMPTGVEAEETFFTTKDQCERAVTGCYDIPAWSGNGFPDCYLWMVGDIMSDDAQKGGETPADMSFLGDLKHFIGKADNSISLNTWQHMYWAIYRCNLVIKNVPGAPTTAELTDALKKRYVAEAKFVRGHCYFTLVTFFGGVPLVTVPLKPEESRKARDPEDACWAQIIKDFTEAAADLPAKSKTDIGRATSGAANAYLAKACIYTKRWAEAEAAAQKVIASAEYSLLPDYNTIFTSAGQNGPESVFEWQHPRGPNNGWGNQNEGSTTPDFQGSRDGAYASGWGFDCPDSNLVLEFEAGDVRKAATIYGEGDTLNKGTPKEEVVHFKTYRASPWCNRKTVKEYWASVPEMSNWPYNKRLIRYADVLLFLAEAQFEQGKTGDALTNLNLVRTRAKLAALTQLDRNAIYHERRVELAMEGHRFFDVIRQGRGTECFGKNGFNSAKDHGHLPIPQSEIDINTLLTQNSY